MRHIELSEADRTELRKLQNQNGLRSWVFKRVTALSELDKGKTIEEVRMVLHFILPAFMTVVDFGQAAHWQL